MLIFHEGLPRSGKSYAACKDHIVPALLAQRKVFAYIDGLDHVRFAEVTQLPLERIQELLIQIHADQVKEIYKHVEKDSLVVLDELQDFFPSQRQPLTEQMTRFITQHGHEGLDILCMGQDLRDCHAVWKRRVQRKITFCKLTAVGMENKYKWEAHEAKGGERFEKISTGIETYDKKYFGLYKSHTPGTENKGNYADDRINIFKTKFFRFGLPAAAVLGIGAVWYLYGFFTTPKLTKIETAQQQQKTLAASTVPTVTPQPTLPQESKKTSNDFFANLVDTSGHRLRYSGMVSIGPSAVGLIDVLDSSYRVIQSFRSTDLHDLGWEVRWRSYGLDIIKGKLTYIAMTWPLESWGRVSEQQQTDMVAK